MVDIQGKMDSVTGRDAWKEGVRFRFEDWGWVVINIGMGIGAGIAMLPVEIGMKGFWVSFLPP